jgi:hypothetical protein
MTNGGAGDPKRGSTASSLLRGDLVAEPVSRPPRAGVFIIAA